MESINILIVEDQADESEVLQNVLTRYNYHVVGVATNLQEALRLFYSQKVDLAIIDIYLSEVPDGITFAETINSVSGVAKPFVFLTSSSDRKTFERAKLTHPFSYLLKPFNELEVLYAIEMAIEKFYIQSDSFYGNSSDTVMGNDFLFIKKGRALKKVDVQEILYIEVEERYCNVFTPEEKFVVMISLIKMTELLGDRFIRTHRNHIINLDKTKEIVPGENYVVMEGDHHIPLSDKYKDFLKRVRTLK